MNTLDYAKNELKKYFKAVTGENEPSIRLIVERKGHAFDDAFEVNVVNGVGEITGSNERAVLLGVYKFFYELGCRFIRPGKNGEVLVKRKSSECTVQKTYKPKYRYRGVCSEGAISEENITDMVEWLPKVGMNSYFMQFVDGHLFFEKWYAHKDSSVLKSEEYSVEKSKEHYEEAVKAIQRCGLIFQAVGHGWTTEPLGYETYGENCSKEKDILPEHRELFAQVKGKRGFFESPGNTQLCYSQEKARNVITDGIVKYLEKHSEVDVLHFWLADSINNHCECENCKKLMPSEWYATMLNELDDKLTKKGITTKIVFLIYCDLLFAPQKVQIKNLDRFIMMYAPIARDFFNPLFTDGNLKSATQAPAFVRNQNNHPRTAGEYLYYLNEWEKKVQCDSFCFDYHLMLFLYGGEPSSLRISRTIYEDMKGLKKVGLNGNISCQLQRTFIPTSLPNYAMAEGLFGTDRSFAEVEEENLKSSFGTQWEKVRTLLHKIEEFYIQDYMCGKVELAKGQEQLEGFIQSFKEWTNEICYQDEHPTVEESLKNLQYFIQLQERFLQILLLKAKGESTQIKEKEIYAFIDEKELSVQPFEDSLFRKGGLKAWL